MVSTVDIIHSTQYTLHTTVLIFNQLTHYKHATQSTVHSTHTHTHECDEKISILLRLVNLLNRIENI